MYVTAHQVVSREGAAGVNAFLHRHGAGFQWPQDVRVVATLADVEPGEIVGSDIAISPGGNRVRSYLDVLAPDGMPADSILAAMDELESGLHQHSNPVVVAMGGVVCRFGVDRGLEPRRAEELRLLAAKVEALLTSSATELWSTVE